MRCAPPDNKPTPEEVARFARQVIAALPQAEPADRAEEASTIEQREKKSAVASTDAASLEVTSKTAEPPSDAGHDAAQQNTTSSAKTT